MVGQLEYSCQYYQGDIMKKYVFAYQKEAWFRKKKHYWTTPRVVTTIVIILMALSVKP